MLKKMLRVPRVLWLALVVASLLYVLVLVFVQKSPGRGSPPPQGLFLPFLIVAGTVAVVSFVLPWALYRKGLQQLDLAHEKSGARGLGLSHPTVKRLLAIYQTSFILSMALSESVSLFGFALGFLGYPWSQSGVLLGAGTLLLLLRFPTDRAVLGPLEDLRGVRVDPAS